MAGNLKALQDAAAAAAKKISDLEAANTTLQSTVDANAAEIAGIDDVTTQLNAAAGVTT